jgi:hypothetical protein
MNMKFFVIFISIIFFNSICHSQTVAYDSVPVRLSSLEATKDGSDVRLHWKVVCYLEYAKFEIQRSFDGYSYATINSFEADQLRCKQPFYFTDARVAANAFYRIRVGDVNGRFYHSKIVAIAGSEKGFEINSLTPSFVNSLTVLSISSAATGYAEIAVTNLQGALVKHLKINLNKGTTDIVINTDRLAKGNYIVKVTNGSADIKTARFVKP